MVKKLCHERGNSKKIILLIFLTISWMCVIFLFSSQPASQSADISSNIARLILKAFSRVFDGHIPGFITSGILNGDHYVRKFGHFFEYLMLGVLCSGTLREIGVKKTLLYSVAICAVYASTDEFHQIFVPGRGPLVTDVLLDSASAIVGSFFINKLFLWKKARKQKLILSNRKLISLFVWVAVALWLLFIFSLSSQPAKMSNHLSKSVTRAAVSTMDRLYSSGASPKKIEKQVARLNSTVREYAHASVYLVLAILSFTALKSCGLSQRKTLLFSFLFCALYAASDEFHQFFVPGRSLELIDFTLDCMGAAFGLLLSVLCLRVVRFLEKIMEK